MFMFSEWDAIMIFSLYFLIYMSPFFVIAAVVALFTVSSFFAAIGVAFCFAIAGAALYSIGYTIFG